MFLIGITAWELLELAPCTQHNSLRFMSATPKLPLWKYLVLFSVTPAENLKCTPKTAEVPIFPREQHLYEATIWKDAFPPLERKKNSPPECSSALGKTSDQVKKRIMNFMLKIPPQWVYGWAMRNLFFWPKRWIMGVGGRWEGAF